VRLGATVVRKTERRVLSDPILKGWRE